MNLPNKLTISRFMLTVAFMAVIISEVPFNETIALLLFSVASLTDYFDGMIARRDKLVTNFGILMDPLVDKILICSAFIAFVGLHLIPAWMAVVIVAREFAITGLRLLAASKQVVLPAENWGKAKTIVQIIAILAVLVTISYSQWGALGKVIFEFNIFGPWVVWFTALSTWTAVALTFYSGVVYLWRNRQLYLRDL